MKQAIREIMTPEPMCVQASSTIDEAAAIMRDRDVGDVLVMRDGELCGIVTDRDIVIRALAEGKDTATTQLGDICSQELVCLSPDDAVDKAVEMMRERAIRRIPIVENGKPVGLVSLGDLAVERDPSSALADISAAPPNG